MVNDEGKKKEWGRKRRFKVEGKASSGEQN